MVVGGLSLFLVVFLGFYTGFGGLELETIVKTKKSHQNSILRDSLKIVFFWFFLVLQWFWWFVVVVGGFS